jgi:serine/threonine protein kinase/tetratricopeptide (TPR) repeat protein
VDSARWQQIQAVFHEAAGLAPEDQRAFVDSRCGGDAALAGEIFALLEEDARGDSLLDRDIGHVADQILNTPSADHSSETREFGAYRVIRKLGEGGMGVVFLGERADLGSQVAIKVLRDAWLSPARRARFTAEQRTLAQLNHPWIARLYDADTTSGGTPFFVMEYVEGAPLTEYCRRHNCSIEERLRLFRDVCQAVLYAHQNAVIHRDLKPSNILVRDDSAVRLLDFGIAKQIATLGAEDQTITALRLMTPAYAAPEQFSGEQVGILADVYSLGVVLYELLAGKLPFDVAALPPTQAVKILVEQQPEKPSSAYHETHAANPSAGYAASLRPSAWADLDVLCLTAMHKDPRQRYQSVEALIRDVNHYLKGEPLDARPDSLRYTAGKFIRRNRNWLSAAAAVLAAVIALIVVYTVKLTRARNAAVAETARTKRIQDFTVNLFQGGDPSAGPAEDLRAVTLLDRGARDAHGLDADPASQADLYDTLGGINEKLGRFDQANTLLESALKERNAMFGPDSTEAAASLLALGSLRDSQAKYDDAEKLTRQALDIYQRKLKPNDPAIGKAMLQLGGVLEDRGEYPQAIAQLEKTVNFFSAPGASQADLADSLHELANANYYAGNHEVSNGINLRALVMYKQIYGDRHPRVADILINLGAIESDAGHYPAAEMYDRQALAIVQNWYGKDSVVTAADLTILARTLVLENRYDDALALLKQSLAIKEAAYGKVHPTVASTVNELGTVALRKGNYEEALAYFNRMADICRTVYGEHHYWYATALSNIGSVYSAQKDWPRAEKQYRMVIPIYTEAQSATSTNTGIARIKLGRTLLRQKRYSEAESETRAGYDILVKQMDPKVSWLVNARNDLVEEYQALKKPDEVAKFQALIASNAPETKAAASH